MDFFSVLTLAGGLAFFFYGMHILSTGLEKLAGGKLEQALKRMTSNMASAMLLGAGITIAIQSSSTMTVMLVGLVNSGIIEIGQTIGIIMGSNIGTTLTAWLLSLVGIESDNIWLKLLKPENFSLAFALVGAVLVTFSKKQRRKDIGAIFVGFAILMYGMKLMSNAVSPLADSPKFSSILTMFKNPIMGVVVGAVFTGIIQSSAASVGILQALALTGEITAGMAIPIIMGQNIGTCVTALLSSIGVNKNAKKVAVIHISFNIIGTVVCLALFYIGHAIFDFALVDSTIDALGIALVHSIFNVFTTAILCPFPKLLEKIANTVLKEDKTAASESDEFLDARLLSTPSVAIAECANLCRKMAVLSKDTVLNAFNLLDSYDDKLFAKVFDDEGTIDHYEDWIGSYLVKLSTNSVSESDNRKTGLMLHTIGNFERISDHAANLATVAQELKNKKLTFSEDGVKDTNVLVEAVKEILDITITAYENEDLELAYKVEPLEEVIDELTLAVKNNHITRLQAGSCSIEMGFILSDLLSNCERVSDHCSNIALALIETVTPSFEAHKYIDSLSENNRFDKFYHEYKEKYTLA